jgi:hypothetical protein
MITLECGPLEIPTIAFVAILGTLKNDQFFGPSKVKCGKAFSQKTFFR